MGNFVFDEMFINLIENWKMDGNVTRHMIMREYRIGVLFRFRHQYLAINEVINFDADAGNTKVFEEALKHLKEIKTQFYAYFNAIWC